MVIDGYSLASLILYTTCGVHVTKVVPKTHLKL